MLKEIFYDLDSEVDPERLQYLYVYTILIVVVLYLVFQRALALFYFCLKASRRIHEKLFNSVTRTQMYFFNKNSSGRIINRFSKDINDIDYYLPTVLYDSILVSSENIKRKYKDENSKIKKKLLLFSVRTSSDNFTYFGIGGKLLVGDTNGHLELDILWFATHLCANSKMPKANGING